MAAQRPKPPVVDQISAGGVAFRRGEGGFEVALIAVGEPARWQLPKGLVNDGETPETTALREVREEAGIETALIAFLEQISYWYSGAQGGRTVRFRKRVHFFLLAYQAGDVADHDHEVNEARWVPIAQAGDMLAFKGERSVVHKAQLLLNSQL